MQKKGINKTISENRLFWFLKEGTEINLQDKSQLDLYIQQILSCGKAEDIRQLLKTINPSSFRESFNRIKRFLKKEVRTFWRDYLESSV